MKKVQVILILFYGGLVTIFAQGEIDDQKKIFYRNERTFAAILNTNGYGGGFRYAKRLDAFRKSTYELEFSYVKDEKEIKVNNFTTQQISKSYVPGKLNAFYTLRMGIGYQKELFQKRDKGGISIRYFYNFGPVLGFLKPVYYELDDSLGAYVKFQPDIGNIRGRAPFYKGFDEISVVPGAYGKFGFTFEFSKSDKVFSAIEAGAAVSAFTKKIPIMANNSNQFAFFTFFISYRFGKIIDSQFKNQTNKIDEVISK